MNRIRCEPIRFGIHTPADLYWAVRYHITLWRLGQMSRRLRVPRCPDLLQPEADYFPPWQEGR